MSAWPVDEEELEAYGGAGKPTGCRGPATPTWRASSSTSWTTCATCWSAPRPRDAARVAAGAMAKALLALLGIEVRAHVLQSATSRPTPPAWLHAADFDRAEASRGARASTPAPSAR